MPDICMCKGQIKDRVCPFREECYRYTATPDKYAQSYFVTSPVKFDEPGGLPICDHQMGVTF